MEILVIQTVRKEVEIMIYDTKRKLLIDSMKWISEKNELEFLIKYIDKLLNKTMKQRDTESKFDMTILSNFVNIDGILVFNGIGAFSATRIGVTVANILANFGKKKLWEITVEENNNEEILELIQDDRNWKKVKISIPEYKMKPMITVSKKIKF